jgi:hypothetical protein
MEIYHLAEDPHVQTAVVVYFPKERVLVSADSFSATWPTQAYVGNLIAQVQKRQLRVDTHVPIHGTPMKSAEVTKLAGSR